MIRYLILCMWMLLPNILAQVGDVCEPSTDVKDGVCTLVTDCEVAISSLKKNRYHPFKRCGFRGNLEIVCCPRTTEKFGTTESNSRFETSKGTTQKSDRLSQRIADRECKKIVESNTPALDLHILGGERASLGEFPHMVALGYVRDDGYKFDCGGSLISSTYVLTAAHCVDTLDKIEPTIARLGTVEIGEPVWSDETDIRIAQIIRHPQYARKEKYHDLTLLRLEKPVQFSSYKSPACLYTQQDDPRTSLTITGWGTTSNIRDLRSTVLLQANVSYVDRSDCNKSYMSWRKLPNGISGDQMCAGDPEGIRDTCQGDSGGPLQGLTTSDGVFRIIGVTSFGRGCGTNVPGVYTRVSKYIDWIESVVWQNK